jgi:hypothetical protein
MVNRIPDEIRDRAFTFRILKTHREGKRLDRALSDGFSSYHPGAPGKGLINELVNGVVRQKARLDHHLLFFYPGVSVRYLLMSG